MACLFYAAEPIDCSNCMHLCPQRERCETQNESAPQHAFAAATTAPQERDEDGERRPHKPSFMALNRAFQECLQDEDCKELFVLSLSPSFKKLIGALPQPKMVVGFLEVLIQRQAKSSTNEIASVLKHLLKLSVQETPKSSSSTPVTHAVSTGPETIEIREAFDAKSPARINRNGTGWDDL